MNQHVFLTTWTLDSCEENDVIVYYLFVSGLKAAHLNY